MEAAAVEVEAAEEEAWAERDGCDPEGRTEGVGLFPGGRAVEASVDVGNRPSFPVVDGFDACLVGALASLPLVVAGIEVAGGKRALGRGASKTVGRVSQFACVVE